MSASTAQLYRAAARVAVSDMDHANPPSLLRGRSGRRVHSRNPGLVAATEHLDTINDDSSDLQHASTAATIPVRLSFGRISPTPVDRIGTQTPDCPHGPWQCSICHPDEASGGSPRSTAIVNTSTGLEDVRSTQPVTPPGVVRKAQ